MARGVRGLKTVTLLVLPIVLPPNDVIKSRHRRLFTLYGLGPFRSLHSALECSPIDIQRTFYTKMVMPGGVRNTREVRGI